MKSLVFTLFSFLLISSWALDDDRYDANKPTFFMNAGLLLKDLNDPEKGFSAKGEKFLETIVSSKKFNIILTDAPWPTPTGGPLSVNGSVFMDMLREQSSVDVSSVMVMANKGQTDPRGLAKIMNGTNFYDEGRKPEDLDTVFYHLADLLHHPSANKDDFSNGGINPLNDDPKLKELLFGLGEKVFEDDFDFTQIKPDFNYNSQPRKCSVMGVSVDIELCKELIQTQYRWVKEGSECGLFEVNAKQWIELVNINYCRAEYLIEFEDKLQSQVLTHCAESMSCLNKVMNDESLGLVDTFHSLLLKSRIDSLRTKVTSDEAYQYEEDLNQLKRELNQFRLQCETENDFSFIKEYLDPDGEGMELYQKGLTDLEKGFLIHSKDSFTEEEKREAYAQSIGALNKCLREELQNFKENQRDGSRFLPENEKWIIKMCQYNQFSYLLSETAKKGAGEKHYLSLENLEGVCPIKEIRALSRQEIPILRSFNINYDSERCFDTVIDNSQNIEKFSLYQEMGRFSQVIGVRDPTYPKLAEEYFNRCVSEGSASREECERDALVKTKAEVIYNYLLDHKEYGENETIRFSREKEAKEKFISGFIGDAEVNNCFNDPANRSQYYSKCKKIALRLLVTQEPTLRRGREVIDLGQMAEDALVDDLDDIVVELDREISVFHWGEAGLLNGAKANEPIPVQSLRSRGYLNLRQKMFHVGPVGNFFVPGSDNGTNAGRGLYAAADPNSTSRYGDILFEIKVPEGERYLDLRRKGSQGAIPLSKDTLQKLSDAGCKVGDHAKYYYEQEVGRGLGSDRVLIDKAVFESRGDCHRLFSRAINELDVGLLSYGYEMEVNRICDSKARTRGAFVFIDMNFRGRVNQFNQESITQALKDYHDKGTPIPEEIKRIMQITEGTFKGAKEFNENTPDEEIMEYWKERLFHCDGLKEEFLHVPQ